MIAGVNERKHRIEKLQHRLQEAGVDAFIVTQNVDLFYFTGSMQAGYLLVPRQGEAIFYVKRSLQRAVEESAVRVEPLGSFRDFGKRIAGDQPAWTAMSGRMLVFAVEYDVAPAALVEKFKDIIPNAEWQDGSALIRELRMVKSAYEINKIKEAARVVDESFRRSLSYIREGMPEYELIARIEFDLRMNGHLGLMRMRAYNQEIVTGVVGAGEAVAKPTYFDGPGGGTGLSAASPQGAGRRVFRRGEPILIDIGCCIDGYVIDQTRTVSIGEPESEMRDAYELAERILRETEAQLKPGISCEELYLTAIRTAGEAGVADHFMGYGLDQVKFLGHGIGLEVDEWPVLAKGFKLPLQEGMVIAIEPKFTFPDKGMVGIENCYAITKVGCEKLTLSPEGIILI